MTDYGSNGPPVSNAATCTYCGKKAVYPHKEPDTYGRWVNVQLCTSCHRAQS